MTLHSRVLLVLTFFAVVANPGMVFGQENQNNSSLVISSSPSGAFVQLRGEYALAGRTPYKVGRRLSGPYKVTAAMNGYEKWNSKVSFSGNGREQLTIRLSPKTRAKAGLRSLIFPGWGQFYSGQKFKGMVLSAATLASVVKVILVDTDYRNQVDDLERTVSLSQNQLLRFEERQKVEALVAAKESEADRLFNDRRQWLLISASIWAYNVLDAVLFFPSYEKQSSLDVRVYSDLSPTRGNSVVLNIAKSF
jgi:hypothetical protein